MSNRKTLEDSILDDLQKTGYPTEILTASIMEQHDWGILHNPSYWDTEENQSREFDIQAYRYWPNAGGSVTVGAYLIVECKKSEAPWVFFTTAEMHHQARLGRFIKWHSSALVAFTSFETPDAVISDDELREFHHYFGPPRLARTFHEALKKQENAEHSPRVYAAVMSTVKATLFRRGQPPPEGHLSIFYPVIVFSGNLDQASVSPDKSIELTPNSHIILAFNYIQHEPTNQGPAWAGQHRFEIDVVHESYLPEFLKIVEAEHRIIASKL